MLNKCAKFHEYSPSGKFNLRSVIELLETADFGPTLRATSVVHLTNFSFEYFYKIFTEDASQHHLYHGAKKVKNDQKLKSRGGPALNLSRYSPPVGFVSIHLPSKRIVFASRGFCELLRCPQRDIDNVISWITVCCLMIKVMIINGECKCQNHPLTGKHTHT